MADCWSIDWNVLYGGNNGSGNAQRRSEIGRSGQWSLGGYGSEWYYSGARAVWVVARNMCASVLVSVRRQGSREVEKLGQTVQAKVAVVVDLCLR